MERIWIQLFGSPVYEIYTCPHLSTAILNFDFELLATKVILSRNLNVFYLLGRRVIAFWFSFSL